MSTPALRPCSGWSARPVEDRLDFRCASVERKPPHLLEARWTLLPDRQEESGAETAQALFKVK